MTDITVAYQGIPGSFSHQAACRYFADSAKLRGSSSFNEIFEMISSGAAQRGLVPIENSLAGSVHEIYDLMQRFEIFVCGETYLRVAHHLMMLPMPGVKPEARLADIRRVISHPKALEQCQGFFLAHPEVERTAFSDTAGAAKSVADKKLADAAAIASEESARLYNLEIIRKNVEDNPGNYTRFLAIAKDRVSIPDADKCSLIFTLPHVPSSLFMFLEVFARHDLNVTKIESRPIHGSPFEYNFHIDFEFAAGKQVNEALEQARERARTLKNLGLYKRAEIPD